MKKEQSSILLIDDEKIVLETVSDDLRREGYHVTTAATAEDALAKFKGTLFDLVITDLIMENKNGIELSNEIKKLNPSIPLMILTGYPTLNTAIEALRFGATDYIIKPCERKELIQKVAHCLKRKEKANRALGFSDEMKGKIQNAGLTPREIEICLLVQKGFNNEEIASQMFISTHTAKNHLKKIHKKLGTHNRSELVALLNQ